MTKRNRFKQMEHTMTYVLLADLVVFILFLISAGFSIIWFKVITAIITILISGLSLTFLYITQEIMKPRSLWMSVAAAAILVCSLFSLILNFPSPSPYPQQIDNKPVITDTVE